MLGEVCLCGWLMLFVVGNQMGIILKWEEGASHLHPFFLHGYVDGRPRTATNLRYNIPTLIFEPMFELSGLSQHRNESYPSAFYSIFTCTNLQIVTENISPPHLLIGAQPRRLLYHSIPTITERNASLKSGFQHFIPPFLQSFHTTQQLTAPFNV